jgi:hypothetical protein
MAEVETTKKGKGYLQHIKGTKGQTYYSGSPKGTPFFEFNVIDHLKEAVKRLTDAVTKKEGK